MDTHLLAYLAGVFDGEGTIGYYSKGKGKKPALTLEVKMTDEKLVKLFHETFGGCLIFKPRAKPHHLDQYRWKVTAHTARVTYNYLFPYLRLKRIDLEPLQGDTA